MSKLLLVEDDVSLGATLDERLRREGYVVAWAQSVAETRRQLSRAAWDLVILDVGLPDGSGFDLARYMAKHNKDMPIVFMTAWSSAENRLEGFELGAVEFIPKPFHLRELLLRLRHVLDNHCSPAEIWCNERRIELALRAIVQPDGQRHFPPARDFALLKLLVEAAPRVVSRDEILDRLWGQDAYPNHRTVDNIIVRLRQLLGDANGQFIRAARGIGYQFSETSK
jgi:DNA-binding response OmpR family regulator